MVLELFVVGEQEQALAVEIEPAHGVYVGHGHKILERGAAVLVGELSEDFVGLVEE